MCSVKSNSFPSCGTVFYSVATGYLSSTFISRQTSVHITTNWNTSGVQINGHNTNIIYQWYTYVTSSVGMTHH